MKIESAKDLTVYKSAFSPTMEMFELTKGLPSDEKLGLVSQIRRSLRSVCFNLRKAWAKRRHEAHFVSKLTDCDGENSETESALDFARDCGYVSATQPKVLVTKCAEIDRMLGAMIRRPESFIPSMSRSNC